MAAQPQSLLYEKSYAFAIRLVNAHRFIVESRREFILSKQFLRCGTSIGANVAEANGAISKNDFSAKISIAYKECLEVKYWLCLLKDTDYIDQRSFDSMHQDADELAKIAYAILKSTRIGKLHFLFLWIKPLFGA